jgi:hypothetical protein
MASFYRQQVDALYEALQNNVETARLEAAAALRALIKLTIAPAGNRPRSGRP